MASKDQYEFFRGLYEEEERTAEQLESRAKVYLGIITAFLVAILLKTDDVIKSGELLKVPFPLILTEAIFLSAALVCVIFALRIRAYEAVNDGVAIIEDYKGSGPTEEEFYEDRIADYAYASSRNRGLNNETAKVLAWSAWLILSGMLVLLVLAILSLWSHR